VVQKVDPSSSAASSFPSWAERLRQDDDAAHGRRVRDAERRASASTSGRDHLRPNQRNVGMVFQSYALFPT
jgi:ABC-type polar amino acid transport system ATPase subunit